MYHHPNSIQVIGNDILLSYASLPANFMSMPMNSNLPNPVPPLVQQNQVYQNLDELSAIAGKFDVFSLQTPQNQSSSSVQFAPIVPHTNQTSEHNDYDNQTDEEEAHQESQEPLFPADTNSVGIHLNGVLYSDEESYHQQLKNMMKYIRHKVVGDFQAKLNKKQGKKRGTDTTIDENSVAKRARKNLPKETVKVLKNWLESHRANPYPEDVEKSQLMQQTKLSKKQVENWFVNARKRYLKVQDKNLSLVPPHIRQKQELTSKLKEKMTAKEPLQQDQ